MERTRVIAVSILCIAFAKAFTIWPETLAQRRIPGGSISALDAATLLTSEEIRERLDENISRLRIKDRQCKLLAPSELQIEHEDEDIIVVVKPAGVLCVPSEQGVHSLVESIFTHIGGPDSTSLSMQQMVVHRLGCDTSGLIIFAKSIEGMRGMHSLFRTRKITRQYEALVSGHVEKDNGIIQFPLMRCFEYPPYMRVATDTLQRHLLTLDPDVVGKRLLEAPKASVTHFQVLDRFLFREDPNLPTTRLRLTSMTGRTHQLNVHCAALGHPIVRDTVYGINGKAAPQGGLETTEYSVDAVVQGALFQAAEDMNMCIHSWRLRFLHPCTGEEMEFTNAAPF